jgi:hypothetical protein
MAGERITHEKPPPGWYDDPGGNGSRWWDGSQWTEHRHGIRSDSEQPQSSAAKIETQLAPLANQPREFWLAGVVLVALIIGSLGTWARAVFASVSGMEGDGKYFALGAVIGIASLWRYAKAGGRGVLLYLGLLGAFVAYDSIRIIGNINDASHTTLFGEDVTVASVGWGLYVTVVTGFALVVLSLILAFGYGPRPTTK